jgi:hypothetical protein
MSLSSRSRSGLQFNIRLPSATIDALDRLAEGSYDPQRVGTPRQQLLIRLIDQEQQRRALLMLTTEPTA